MKSVRTEQPLGYKHSDEIRAKISSKIKGLKKSAEHKAKLSANSVGKIKTDEHRKHISEGMKKSWARRKQRIEN